MAHREPKDLNSIPGASTIHSTGVVGSSASDHITLRPTRRAAPGATLPCDRNWLVVDVDVRVGAFRGRYEANLEVGDFLEFGRRLRSLGASLKGEASFPCIEPWLSIRIFPDRLGHLTAECEATDALFRGARLEFRLDLDQTFIPPTVDALDNIARAFPLAKGPES